MQTSKSFISACNDLGSVLKRSALLERSQKTGKTAPLNQDFDHVREHVGVFQQKHNHLHLYSDSFTFTVHPWNWTFGTQCHEGGWKDDQVRNVNFPGCYQKLPFLKGVTFSQPSIWGIHVSFRESSHVQMVVLFQPSRRRDELVERLAQATIKHTGLGHTWKRPNKNDGF